MNLHEAPGLRYSYNNSKIRTKENSMEINISDYLGPDEIERIVEEEIRSDIRARIRQDNDRLIVNAIYYAVEKHVDAEIESSEDLQVTIKDKTQGLITGLASHQVFRTPDAWSKQRGETDSLGQQLLEEEVRNSKELIAAKVTEIVGELGYGNVRDLVVDAVRESFWNHEENK